MQKTGKYPLGAPEIITENFNQNLEMYFGLIHCRVIPPRGLYFPVLPARFNNKLIFTLCRTCAINQQIEKCIHNVKERSIEGTWVTEEFKLALQNGYTVDKVFSVWHWSQSEQYDPILRKGGLFTEYVDAFLKVKQENSGYPDWCVTEEDKNIYI